MMNKNKFLKVTSFILSVSTFMSSFLVTPSYAQNKISLSKEAKIGIGVGAGVLGSGIILTGISLWLKYGHSDEGESDDTLLTPPLPDDVSLVPKPNTDVQTCNMWKILEENLEKNAKWLDNAYPGLQTSLSELVLGEEGLSNIKIEFIFKNNSKAIKKFNFSVDKVKHTTEELGKFIDEFLMPQRNMGYELPVVSIYINRSPHVSCDARPLSTSVEADDYSTPKGIRKSLAKRAETFKQLDTSVKTKRFKNNWGQLCYFLGNQENIKWVERNYPEWKRRLSKRDDLSPDYPIIFGTNLESFSLISIAYSLLSAKAERYNPADINNNELIVGMPDISEVEVVRPSDTLESVRAARLDKINVLPGEDILLCA
ncbi:MAG: hypothetical protein IKE41_00250, partial [Clostridia bacterium]|nr:hypothetical protein [Clostridia bacterium]